MQFRGTIESFATLGTKAEVRQKDQFIIIQKGITNYVMTTFQNPMDIVPVVRDLETPLRLLMQNMPVNETCEDYNLPSDNVDLSEHSGFVLVTDDPPVRVSSSPEAASAEAAERQRTLEVFRPRT